MHGFSHCKKNACIDNELITGLQWQLIDQQFKFLNIIHNFFYNKNWSPRSKFTSKPCMLYWAPRDHFTETQSMFGYMSITSLESQSGNRILWNNLTILNIIKCVQPYKSRLLSDMYQILFNPWSFLIPKDILELSDFTSYFVQ